MLVLCLRRAYACGETDKMAEGDMTGLTHEEKEVLFKVMERAKVS